MTTLTSQREGPSQRAVTEYIFSKLDFLPTTLQSDILNCHKRFVLVAGGAFVMEPYDSPLDGVAGTLIWALRFFVMFRLGLLALIVMSTANQALAQLLLRWTSRSGTAPVFCPRWSSL